MNRFLEETHSSIPSDNFIAISNSFSSISFFLSFFLPLSFSSSLYLFFPLFSSLPSLYHHHHHHALILIARERKRKVRERLFCHFFSPLSLLRVFPCHDLMADDTIRCGSFDTKEREGERGEKKEEEKNRLIPIKKCVF